jgi:hypothetical protein
MGARGAEPVSFAQMFSAPVAIFFVALLKTGSNGAGPIYGPPNYALSSQRTALAHLGAHPLEHTLRSLAAAAFHAGT